MEDVSPLKSHAIRVFSPLPFAPSVLGGQSRFHRCRLRGVCVSRLDSPPAFAISFATDNPPPVHTAATSTIDPASRGLPLPAPSPVFSTLAKQFFPRQLYSDIATSAVATGKNGENRWELGCSVESRMVKRNFHGRENDGAWISPYRQRERRGIGNWLDVCPFQPSTIGVRSVRETRAG